MYTYKSSAELKSLAKGQLLGNYSTSISVFLVYFAISWIISFVLNFATDTNSIPGLIMYYVLNIIVTLITALFTPGIHYFYMNLVSGRPFKVSDVFFGFSYHPEKTLLLTIINFAIALVCMIPCIILGILYYATKLPILLVLATLLGVIGYIALTIINLHLAQIYYLMLEFPDYSAVDLLKTSYDLMRGQKFRLFYLQVSFIPLTLLSLLSCGIGLFWIQPYMYATYTNFYFDLVRGRQSTQPQEHINVTV